MNKESKFALFSSASKIAISFLVLNARILRIEVQGRYHTLIVCW